MHLYGTSMTITTLSITIVRRNTWLRRSMKTSIFSPPAGMVPCTPVGDKLGMHELPVSGISTHIQIVIKSGHYS